MLLGSSNTYSCVFSKHLCKTEIAGGIFQICYSYFRNHKYSHSRDWSVIEKYDLEHSYSIYLYCLLEIIDLTWLHINHHVIKIRWFTTKIPGFFLWMQRLFIFSYVKQLYYIANLTLIDVKMLKNQYPSTEW